MSLRGWAATIVICGIAGCAFGAPTIGDDDGSPPDATADVTKNDAAPTVCNGQPTDTSTDKANCGSCGHACPASATCTYGTCQCPSGGHECSGTCVDMTTDLKNCGKCGNDCAALVDGGLSGGGTWACVSSVCTVQCGSTLTACGTGCFDTTTDDTHCGTCATDCAGETCCASNCSDTTSDNANCGKCGTACTTAQTCSSGHCCTTGQTWCTSACTNTMTDVKNCGKCGNACATGQTCSGGNCCAAPAQGTCAHPLCDSTTGTALKKSCDPSGCVTKVCAADAFCCGTAWDIVCVDEVATYCSPYSCTGC